MKKWKSADFKRLNEGVRRERYVLPTAEEITAKLSGATMFTSLDAASGFWQIPLHPESTKLTTFITPFGRYAFKRLPFGITSAPENVLAQDDGDAQRPGRRGNLYG